MWTPFRRSFVTSTSNPQLLLRRPFHTSPSPSRAKASEPPLAPSVKVVLKPWERDIGGFSVRRVLPAVAARHIGPFVFFDQMGPAFLPPGKSMDVRPHPHIGLATVTYLFEGAIMHRDSLGSVQKIVPGDVNWMTAGKGIVHSERSPPEDVLKGHNILGIQTWVALPVVLEDIEPSFEHHERRALPQIDRNGVSVRVIAGSAFGKTAPTKTYSPTLYAAAQFAPGSSITLEPEHEERAVYLVQGDLSIDGITQQLSHMAVLKEGEPVKLSSDKGALVMVLGGAKLDGERFIEWNFVSSSREKIERVKAAWTRQEIGKVPGETEWIPLPEPKVPK